MCGRVAATRGLGQAAVRSALAVVAAPRVGRAFRNAEAVRGRHGRWEIPTGLLAGAGAATPGTAVRCAAALPGTRTGSVLQPKQRHPGKGEDEMVSPNKCSSLKKEKTSLCSSSSNHGWVFHRLQSPTSNQTPERAVERAKQSFQTPVSPHPVSKPLTARRKTQTGTFTL